MHGLLSPTLSKRVCVPQAMSKGYNSIWLFSLQFQVAESIDPNLFSPAPDHMLLCWGNASVTQLLRNQEEAILFTGGTSSFLLVSKHNCPMNESGSRKVGMGKDRPAFSAPASSASLWMSPWTEGWENLCSSNTLDPALPLAQSSCHPCSCSGRLHCNNYHFVPTPFSLYSNTLPERGALHSQRKQLNYLQSYNKSDTSSGTWISSIVNLLLIFFFSLLC